MYISFIFELVCTSIIFYREIGIKNATYSASDFIGSSHFTMTFVGFQNCDVIKRQPPDPSYASILESLSNNEIIALGSLMRW